MKKTFYAIISSLFVLSVFIHTSCLEGEFNGNTQDSAIRLLIGFPTQQCLDRSAGQDESTQQSILDCVILFTLTITDGFDPIVETFGIGEEITVLVPVGEDRNFMIEGTDENGELCCSGGVTADVFPGQNTIEITCIPVPTPTPTPPPTPIPTPPPSPTPVPTPPPTPIPTPPPSPTPVPPPTPIPTPTPSPTPVPTPTPTPMGCETDEDCPQGEICSFVNDVGMCVPGCRNDSDCPPGKICDFEANMCVRGCNVEEPNCPGNQVCIDGMCQPGPKPTPTPMIMPERANDGIDNDGDGRVDCADSDSVGQTGPCGETCEEHETICDDSFDNDGDGKIDCADSDCANSC